MHRDLRICMLFATVGRIEVELQIKAPHCDVHSCPISTFQIARSTHEACAQMQIVMLTTPSCS